MQAGVHNGISKTNLVLKAPQEIAFSLDVKRQRAREKSYQVLGCIESIVFDPNDSGFSIDKVRDPHMRARFRRGGRHLYWPENCPLIARTRPEEDLIFTQPIQLRSGCLPDVSDLDETEKRNPYMVDHTGQSKLRGKWKDGKWDGDAPLAAPKYPQPIESAASGKYRNFLVFHPIAQIITLQVLKGEMAFGSMGSHRMPISSLSGVDGRKLSLLVDPKTGEAFFIGGRYYIDPK